MHLADSFLGVRVTNQLQESHTTARCVLMALRLDLKLLSAIFHPSAKGLKIEHGLTISYH